MTSNRFTLFLRSLPPFQRGSVFLLDEDTGFSHRFRQMIDVALSLVDDDRAFGTRSMCGCRCVAVIVLTLAFVGVRLLGGF